MQEVRHLGIDLQVSQRVPPGRLHALVRFASKAEVSATQRLPEPRRLATLVAFASNLEACALDDALDLLDILIAQAIAELGRIDKTIHALTYIDDESKRRRILNQLNRGEERHKLGRALFHGKRGELPQRYREGQEVTRI